MSILDRWFGRRADGRAEPVSFIGTATRSERSGDPRLKRGRWVISDGRAGIIDSFVTPTVARVHLVDGKGETVEVVTRETSVLRVATIDDIPEPRRPQAV